jgi:putative ATP-dependent endonuclease of the OLD family
MKLVHLTLSNFQSFGPTPTTIDLERLTYVLGPNGAGKTAVLQALVRLFGVDRNLRRVRSTDFHVTTTGAIATTLWLEADFEVPEAADDLSVHATVPPFFSHMQLESSEGPPRLRIRLSARVDEDGEIEEKIHHILQVDDDGAPVKPVEMSRSDRNMIQVHYLPARRDPAEQVTYAATSMLGRALRAADWSAEKAVVTDLAEQINSALASNGAILDLGTQLASRWEAIYSGAYFAKPAVAFGQGEIDQVFRYLTLSFTPAPHGDPADLSLLSDGQKSLLYISLVLALHNIGRDVLAGKSTAFDPDKLRPAVFTIVAVEEPENSLSPHYLGRVTKALQQLTSNDDAQGLIATHSPALLRRVPPEHIRYLRLNTSRQTTIRRIVLPAAATEAHKFVREAVQAFPELYFSRLVVLGEGDSEEIVLPRVLAAQGIAEDDTSVVVVPLGGRHVNHFWRLLHELDIPHVTLLDLDLARHGGGWGRVSYAAKQLRAFASDPTITATLTDKVVDDIPKWDSDVKIGRASDAGTWPALLEGWNVFFSTPLDLDYMMLVRYHAAYGIDDISALEAPTDSVIEAVLGKARHGQERYQTKGLSLFDRYYNLFKLGSKPSAHIDALSNLDDAELLAHLPPVFARMLKRISDMLAGQPE